MIGMCVPPTAPSQLEYPHFVSNLSSMRSKSSPVGMSTYLGVYSSCIEMPTPNRWLRERYSTFVASFPDCNCNTMLHTVGVPIVRGAALNVWLQIPAQYHECILGHPQIQREHFVWPGGDVDRCCDIPGPPVIPGQSPNCSLRRTYEQCTQNHEEQRLLEFAPLPLEYPAPLYSLPLDAWTRNVHEDLPSFLHRTHMVSLAYGCRPSVVWIAVEGLKCSGGVG